MKRLAALASLALVVGAGLGTYFAVSGSPAAIPKSERDAGLERAKAAGVITGYGVLLFRKHQCAINRGYVVDGGQVAISEFDWLCSSPAPGLGNREVWHTARGLAQATKIQKFGGGELMECGPCSPEKEVKG